MQQSDFAALAAFRLEIRRFMDFSRELIEGRGLPPAQYQAMLAIKAHDGTAFSIGDLAAELFVKVQTAVELVARMQQLGLVDRHPSPQDRRRIIVSLTARGEAMLLELAAPHLKELQRRLPGFTIALDRFAETSPPQRSYAPA